MSTYKAPDTVPRFVDGFHVHLYTKRSGGDRQDEELQHYSGPCDLRLLYLTIPCILRQDISDTTCIFSV